MKLLAKPITTREEFHKKISPKLLEQMGLLEESLGKISLADKLEGKTKQYIGNMNQEQINDFSSLNLKDLNPLPERYEETKAKFLEATKDLEFLSGMLFYVEDNQLKSEVIMYDRKHYDEVNSPFLNVARDRLTKEYVMEIKEKYGIKK